MVNPVTLNFGISGYLLPACKFHPWQFNTTAVISSSCGIAYWAFIFAYSTLRMSHHLFINYFHCLFQQIHALCYPELACTCTVRLGLAPSLVSLCKPLAVSSVLLSTQSTVHIPLPSGTGLWYCVTEAPLPNSVVFIILAILTLIIPTSGDDIKNMESVAQLRSWYVKRRLLKLRFRLMEKIGWWYIIFGRVRIQGNTCTYGGWMGTYIAAPGSIC